MTKEIHMLNMPELEKAIRVAKVAGGERHLLLPVEDVEILVNAVNAGSAFYWAWHGGDNLHELEDQIDEAMSYIED